MSHLLSSVFFIMLLCSSSCLTQTAQQMNEANTPLNCDTDTGVCEVPDHRHVQATSQLPVPSKEKPVKIIYYTDPICSSCWGIEPQLRRLKLEYGNAIDIEYRMGGLLPDWSYNSGGISKPADVAQHWDEVSLHYDMPIDGDVWLEDPLDSSYPPSIAVKAAQIQSPEKALRFMRAIRELVFLEKKNITKWEFLKQAAQEVELDVAQFKTDYEGAAKLLFQQDLTLGEQLRVRGFPTLFFSNSAGKSTIVYGSKPYAEFEAALLRIAPGTTKQAYAKDWEHLFNAYPTLTAKEFAVLSDVSRNESERLLDGLVAEKKLEKHTIKNGSIWKKPTKSK